MKLTFDYNLSYIKKRIKDLAEDDTILERVEDLDEEVDEIILDCLDEDGLYRSVWRSWDKKEQNHFLETVKKDTKIAKYILEARERLEEISK